MTCCSGRFSYSLWYTASSSFYWYCCLWWHFLWWWQWCWWSYPQFKCKPGFFSLAVLLVPELYLRFSSPQPCISNKRFPGSLHCICNSNCNPKVNVSVVISALLVSKSACKQCCLLVCSVLYSCSAHHAKQLTGISCPGRTFVVPTISHKPTQCRCAFSFIPEDATLRLTKTQPQHWVLLLPLCWCLVWCWWCLQWCWSVVPASSPL